MEKISMYTKEKIELKELEEYLNASAITADVTCLKIESAILVVVEQYFYRNKSAASCSVMINPMEDSIGGTGIAIISSGGGTGLINISWGATSKYLKKICSIFKDHYNAREVSFR